jgi:hypothetical protein
MSSIAESLNKRGSTWWIALAGMATLIIVAISLPNLFRSMIAVNQVHEYALPESGAVRYQSDAHQATVPKKMVTTALAPAAAKASSDPAADRKMIRTSAVDLVVQKPAEAAETIRALAENVGGFLVSSNVSGGQNATGGSLTIRVPAARFEQAWAEIRKLGLRVEAENIEAKDATQ